MNTYVTGNTIRQLREGKKLTQAELAESIGVSSKTVSKWETGKGLPDITLLQPLAQALGISVIELMNGQPITNRNMSANLLRSKFYVCPLCGNILHSTGMRWSAAAASPCRLWNRRKRMRNMPLPSKMWRMSILSPSATP